MDWDFRSISFQAARDMFYNRFYDRYNENQRSNRQFKRNRKRETKCLQRVETEVAYTLVDDMHGANTNQSGRLGALDDNAANDENTAHAHPMLP